MKKPLLWICRRQHGSAITKWPTILAFSFLLLSAPVARAQISADFSLGGGARLGWSSTACNGSATGAIRYNSGASGSIDFCNGTTWQNIGGVGGGTIAALTDASTNYADGVGNMFLGYLAGEHINTPVPYLDAVLNTALGYIALQNLENGSFNTALGAEAGSGISGSRNTMLGAMAMGNVWAANNNIAVGHGAMQYHDGDNNIAIGSNALRGDAGAPAVDNNVAIGHMALNNATLSGNANTVLGAQAAQNITAGSRNIIIGSQVAAVSATGNDQLNIGNTVYGDLATDFITVGTTAGQMRALPPAAQTIAAGNTVTANACGTIKQITSAGVVTTSTANTFTAPAAANNGCCMDVINTGANNITLDANASFRTIGGADQVLGQYDSVRVCSNGSNWYQIGAVAANQ